MTASTSLRAVHRPEPTSGHGPATDTRDRILDAGERLFMAHGYEGTSMRMITSAAAVNLAAVNYHFGGKEGLLQEVFRRRLGWLNSERLRVLNEMEAEAAARGKSALKPSQIVEAFFGTLLQMGEHPELGGMTFLRLLGRSLTEPAEFIRTFFAQEYAEVVERYREALFQSLPQVPREEISWRFNFMLGAMSYAIAGTDALALIDGFAVSEETDEGEAARRLKARLMPFLLGGLRATLPQFPTTGHP